MHLQLEQLSFAYGPALSETTRKANNKKARTKKASNGLALAESPNVIDDLDLSVTRGESMALLGSSGCGKTTLLRIIAGLEQAQSGQVRLAGRVMAAPEVFVPAERRQIGMVFQDGALFPHMTVEHNVAFGLKRRERCPEVIAAALDLVGMAGYQNRMPATLSGGQRQRVALARALAPKPQILLLDEPFSNLDTGLRCEIRTEVRQLLLELGITTVLVTHDQDEAFVMGDRVGVLHDGKLVQIDTPAELYNRPVDRFVANFVGTASWLAATGDGALASCALGELPLTVPADGPLDVLLRPEQLTLTPLADAAGSNAAQEMGNCPQGVISVVEYYGHDAMAVVTLGTGLNAEQVRVRCEPDLKLQRGDHVSLSFVGSSVMQFQPETAIETVTAPEPVEVPASAPVAAPVFAPVSTD